MSAMSANAYPARLEVDYPERLDRITTLLRLILLIPVVLLLSLMNYVGNNVVVIPNVAILLIRRKYPRWWFDFNLEYTRFMGRVNAYGALLTDQYPSLEDEQSVHIEVDYPDTANLNRFLPLIKWLLALPHYIVLALLMVLSLLAEIISWVAILATEKYPRPLFNFVLGVQRYSLRVNAYAFLLVTDRYPPFSLSA